MTTSYAGGWRDSGARPSTAQQARPGTGIHGPRHGRHRRDRRPHASALLLDPPSATGLPPYRLSAITIPRSRAARLIPTAAVALTLATSTGVAVALSSGAMSTGGMSTGGMSTAPGPSFTPTMVPSVTATSTSPAPGRGATRSPSARGTPSPAATATAVPATTAPPTTAPPTTAPATTVPASAAPRPAITVRYRVVSQWGQGFEGEVAVANNGPSPVSDWQIVVALPDDQFTAVSRNASGYASHHILLLHPASYASQVPANGALSVFFTAYGTELTPQLCAFNDTTCG